MRETETSKMFLFCLFFSFLSGLSGDQPYTCGTLLRGTSGSFSSPDKDGDGLYDPTQRCRWTIVAEEHKMIQLQVHELDIEEQKDCYSDYLAIYDGTELKGYYCGNTVPPIVRSSSRVVYVTFVSNEVAAGKGFNASYEQLIDSDCDHVMSDIAGTFQSAGLNGNDEYGSNVLCMWMIQRFTPEHFLQVLVVEMDIQPSENCEADYLMIRGNTDIPTKHCGTTAPPLYMAASLYTFIVLKSDHNISASGFKAVYTNIDTTGMCGGIQTETNSTILSVDYDGDDKYEIDLKCVWVIAAPQFYAIEMSFVSMEIEWHKNCEWDYIRIFDGYDSYPFNGLIGWYCGNDKPEIIVSDTNIMFIEFISDRDTTFAGFELRYRYINETITGLMMNSSTTNTTEAPVTDTSEPIVNEGIQVFGNRCLLLISTILFKVVHTNYFKPV